MIATAYDLEVFKKSNGFYPSATEPNIFKDKPGCEYLHDKMARHRKQALSMDGYSRNFNLREARLLLEYEGTNEDILKYQNEFITALMINIKDKLEYELEVNNVTEDELQKSRALANRLQNRFVLPSTSVEPPKTKTEFDKSVPDDFEDHNIL